MRKKVVSLIFIALFCGGSVCAQETGEMYLTASIEKLNNAKTYTLKVAELMPAENYSYKPTPEQMSFAEQLIHLSSNLRRLSYKVSNLSEAPKKLDDTLTDKADIREVLEESYEYALSVMQDFDPTQLADTVDFFAGPKSKLQIINLINDHQTHHRGQLMVYLRLKGVEPPRYVGW